MTITVTRGFHPEFERQVVALVLKDASFVRDYRSVCDPDLFADKNHRFLVKTVLDYHDKYRKLPSIKTACDVVRRSSWSDKGGAIELVQTLKKPSDGAYIVDQFLERVRWTVIEKLWMESDGKTASQLADSIHVASRIGDELASRNGRVLFNEDRDEESLQGRIVPTPWEWLNGQISGGPETGDLAVVLSVISGGKTTALINIAHRALEEGLFVVYFTFEDGERKIKRRMMQRITGMDKERMFHNTQRAVMLRDKFLRKYGCRFEIKKMRTNIDTVANAEAFVKSVSGDRKPDVVITDYADRFKARQRYNEPRHALREVFEDCKQLAQTLDVVHWTARQVAKGLVGKSIIGTQHVGESWGSMESPDLVIGFGRTLEDERLERMTLFTAKVRDAEDHKQTSLRVNFGLQKIWSPTDYA